MTATVAVLGSCITRDCFNSRFNPDHKDHYACVLTQNQTSIPSLMSTPVDAEVVPVGAMSDYDRWNVRTELTKEFLGSLAETQPDYLLLDFFADVHFGLLRLDDGRLVTNNWWKVHRTTWYRDLLGSGGLTPVAWEDDPDAYVAQWTEAFDRLVAHVREVSPGTRLVVHRGHYAEAVLREGATKAVRLNRTRKVRYDVAAKNAFWARLDDLAAERAGAVAIDLTDRGYTSFEGHPWGPFYVHYTMGYYREFLAELHRVHLEATATPEDAAMLAAIRRTDRERVDLLATSLREEHERVSRLRRKLRASRSLAERRRLGPRARRAAARVVPSTLRRRGRAG